MVLKGSLQGQALVRKYFKNIFDMKLLQQFVMNTFELDLICLKVSD